MHKLLYFVMLVSLSGCAQYQVVVVRNPPAESPTFTVIPTAHSQAEIAFAARVERAIARTGLRVLERPAFKFIKADAKITESAATATGAAGVAIATGHSVEQPLAVSDVVAMYADSAADYIVATYWDSGTIRIIKREGRALVASEQFRGFQDFQDAEDISLSKSVYSTLLYGGFVKEKYDESRCKIMPGPGAKRDYSQHYK